jgi:hypothetical protein
MMRGEKVVIRLSRREQRQLLAFLEILYRQRLKESKETSRICELIAKVAFACPHKRSGRSAGG